MKSNLESGEYMPNKYKKTIYFNKKNIESLIQGIVLKFLDIENEYFEAELLNTFNEIGYWFNIDRIYCYLFSNDGTLMRISHQWKKNGIVMKREYVQHELVYEYPWLIRKIKNNEHILIDSVENLTDEAYFEKEMLIRDGIKSALFIPLMVQKVVWGFIGFENLKETMNLGEEYIDMLQNFAKSLISTQVRILKEDRFNTELYGQSILLDNSDVQIWSLKNTTVYGKVNEAHAKFFGKDKSELQFQDLYDIFPHDVANRLCEKNLVLFQVNDKAEREFTIKNSMGEERLLLVKSRPIKDYEGNIEYLVCTGEDITEERKIQNELIKAKKNAEAINRSKSYFLANMSHEIRTPMNGIMGFLELLSHTSLTQEQEEYIKETRVASELLLSILNDILDFSKIEAGKIELEYISFNLTEVIESAVKLSVPKAYEKGLEVYIDIAANTPSEVLGDPGRLRQVLNNLINNAVKFTEKGEIVIKVEKVDENSQTSTVYFEVHDTGIGISGNNIDRLFSMFSQVDASTTRKYGGTGLGLAIAKRLVSLMNGEVDVSSKMGEGSVFRFKCKFKKCSKEENIIQKYEFLKGHSVLIVDSNKTGQTIIKNYLAECGWIVKTVANPGEVINELKMAEKNNTFYKIILVNIQNSDDNYNKFAQDIKKVYFAKDFKLIAMAYFSQKKELMIDEKEGYDGILSKPISRKELVARISELLLNKQETYHNEDNHDKLGYKKYVNNNKNYKDGLKILIVDDNRANQMLLNKMLQTLGYNSDIVSNGQEAFEICSKSNYDIIFMDCQMPVMDGYEATTKIRNLEGESKNAIIIALTANAMKGDMEKCIRAGMDDYISKPVNRDCLDNTLAKYNNPNKVMK